MVSRDQLVVALKDIMDSYSKIKLSHGEVRYQKIADIEQGIFQLKLIGFDGSDQIYGSIFDAEIINNKIYLHFDGTDVGIANELVERGIPKDQIVLGWLPPRVRHLTGYAVS